MNPKERVHLFDAWAKKYDAEGSPTQNRFPFEGYEKVLDEAVRLGQTAPGMQVLDLGIGTGNLASRFLQKGCSVWGVDFSQEMILKARNKLPETVLVQADLLSGWPAELERVFDRVVSAYVFHEFDLETKIGLLRKIVLNHISASGRIVIADIAFPSKNARTRASRKWAESWDKNEYYWAADETIAACDRAGLDVGYKQVSSCGGVFVFVNKGRALASSLV